MIPDGGRPLPAYAPDVLADDALTPDRSSQPRSSPSSGEALEDFPEADKVGRWHVVQRRRQAGDDVVRSTRRRVRLRLRSRASGVRDSSPRACNSFTMIVT